MPELLVLRHAKSAWETDAPTDFDRPLAPRGERDRWRLGAWLNHEGLCPDEVVTSSAVRARATAEAVVETCGGASIGFERSRRYYAAGPETWLDRLATATGRRVLICGHNPGLDELVEWLAPHAPLTAAGKLMTTAAVAQFRIAGEWRRVAPPDAELVQLVRPRDL